MTSHDVSVLATGRLAAFQAAGALALGDVHTGLTLARLTGETRGGPVLAAALTVRALRGGSVCLDLAEVRASVEAAILDPALEQDASGLVLDWPDHSAWLDEIRSSPMVVVGESTSGVHPLRLLGSTLYLEKYFRQEGTVLEQLGRRLDSPSPTVDEGLLADALATLFTGEGLASREKDFQRVAAEACVRSLAAVIAGGPGTGKTTTVAKLLATLQTLSTRPLRVALAAPSGKAAARLQESVAMEVANLPDSHPAPVIPRAVTLHRLLGARGTTGEYVHSRSAPLSHDVVVIDEMSMVPLPMMARLVDALRPDARLIMVGDPDQLTPVDAGAVLADIVGAWTQSDPRSIVHLEHNWRSHGEIPELAAAIRAGQPDAALDVLRRGESVTLVADEGGNLASIPGLAADIVGPGAVMYDCALRGDAPGALAALNEHRLVCAHREGPFGMARWGRMVEELLRASWGADRPAPEADPAWYVGRPVMVLQNNPDLGIWNGDTGVVLLTGQGLRVAIGDQSQSRLLSPFLLDGNENLFAMTVHKSQGSEFAQVTLVLPPVGSPLLTRELLYTAVTRAKSGVRIIGTEEALTAAIATRARRASGLQDRWGRLERQGGPRTTN